MIAQLLTAVYMVVMVIVIIGMALQFAEEGLESPSAIFFLATMGSFVVTGGSLLCRIKAAAEAKPEISPPNFLT